MAHDHLQCYCLKGIQFCYADFKRPETSSTHLSPATAAAGVFVPDLTHYYLLRCYCNKLRESSSVALD